MFEILQPQRKEAVELFQLITKNWEQPDCNL